MRRSSAVLLRLGQQRKVVSGLLQIGLGDLQIADQLDDLLVELALPLFEVLPQRLGFALELTDPLQSLAQLVGELVLPGLGGLHLLGQLRLELLDVLLPLVDLQLIGLRDAVALVAEVGRQLVGLRELQLQLRDDPSAQARSVA